MADGNNDLVTVAWRWRFDDLWSFGVNRPSKFRFGNPDQIEELVTRSDAERANGAVRRGTLLEAAAFAENFSFAKDTTWWLRATKKEASAEACFQLATALRALAEENSTDSDTAPDQLSGPVSGEAANTAEEIIRRVRRLIVEENKHAAQMAIDGNSTRDEANECLASLLDFTTADCDNALRLVNRRRSPRASPQPSGLVQTLDREDVAKLVYDAMTWAASFAPKSALVPIWMDGGNSDAQTEARRCADRILSALTAGEPAKVPSGADKTCIRCGGTMPAITDRITCDLCTAAIRDRTEPNGADRSGQNVPATPKPSGWQPVERALDIAKIIDPHAFSDLPETSEWAEDMVLQSRELALSKALRILDALAAAPTAGGGDA